MEASVRPLFTAGVALVGASVIAIAPITPSSPAADVRDATSAISSGFQLTDFEIPYILTFPIVRQSIRNWAENWTVYLAGLAQSGVGLVESLLAIPGATVEIVQELFDLNFVGAFETFTEAVRDSVIAVGQPLLDSAIWRNQKYLAVQTALQAAWPQAVIDVANGFLEAANVVTVSAIEGTQNFVAAVLTFNLSTIIGAAVDGTTNFLLALGDGAGAIVGGIEAAQLGIATALATEPPTTSVADVSVLRTPEVDAMPSLAGRSNTVTLDTVTPIQKLTTTVADEVDTVIKTEPQNAPEAAAASDASPSAGIPDDVTAPADPPKQPVHATPVKDTVKRVEETVKRVTDRVTVGVKVAGVTVGVKKDAGVTKDAGTEPKPKPASDAGDE